MFKIVENGNGTTSIFCKESGQLVCTVHGKKSSVVGVSRPFKKETIGSNEDEVACYNNSSSMKLLNEESYVGESIKNREKTYSIDDDLDNISFVSSASSSEVEDPSDDCIDDIAFLQSLNLIRAKELNNRSISQLQNIFPLRKISRTKECLKHHCIDMLENIKIFEETELCSPLGHYALDSCRKQLLNKKESTELVKKYEKYCQISVLSVHPNTVNLPQLRCREALKYPVTFRPNKNWKSYWCHQYSFGHKQRNLRYKTLKTGLNEKSRKLKKLCKKVQVVLPRLAYSKIPDVKVFGKRTLLNTNFPIIENKIEDNININLVLNSNNCEPKEIDIVATDVCDASVMCPPFSEKPIVKLENILEKLVWIGNDVYIKNTNICISDDDISTLNIDKPPNILRMKRMSWIRNNSEVTEWVPLVNKFNILRQKQNIDENENKSVCKEIQNCSNSLQNFMLKNGHESVPKQILSEANRKLKRIHTCSNACNNIKTNEEISQHNCNYLTDDDSIFHNIKKRLNAHNICIISEENSCFNSLNMNPEYNVHNQLSEDNKIKQDSEFWGKPSNGNSNQNILSPKIHPLNNFNYSFFNNMDNIHYINENNNSILIKKISSNDDKNEMKTKSEITVTPCWSNLLKYSNIKSSSPLKRNVSKVLPVQQIQENSLSTLDEELEVSSSEIISNDIEILPDILIENKQQPKIMSSYIFKCHGCGFNASFKTNHQLLNTAHHHMMMYHSVMDPSTFLSQSHTEYVDHLELTIEAFPSYKSSSLSQLQV